MVFHSCFFLGKFRSNACVLFLFKTFCEEKKNRFEYVKTKAQKCSRIEAKCRFAYWSWWICVNVRRVKREENLKSTNVAYIPDFPTQHLVSWETLDQGKEWHCEQIEPKISLPIHPPSLFAFIIWLAPSPHFPTFIIIWRPPTSLIWNVVSETFQQWHHHNRHMQFC